MTHVKAVVLPTVTYRILTPFVLFDMVAAAHVIAAQSTLKLEVQIIKVCNSPWGGCYPKLESKYLFFSFERYISDNNCLFSSGFAFIMNVFCFGITRFIMKEVLVFFLLQHTCLTHRGVCSVLLCCVERGGADPQSVNRWQ